MLLYFGHKFDSMSKELILRYYRTEPKKFAVAENFYSQKWESKSMFQILDKNSFQVKCETPKHGMHTPAYKYGKYPSLGLL